MELQQNDNVGCWSEYWNASVEDAGITDDGQISFWNRRSGSYSESVDNDASWAETVERVFGLLEEAGFSACGSSVLDIGCGPGPLSLPLARAGAEVTALDISSGMLKRLKEKAAGEGLSIRTVEGSWWTADIDELGFRDNFDLVIASMTPAIKDLDTFDRMTACSKHFCYYSGFLRRGGSRNYQEIYNTILNEDHPDRESGMPQMFMLYPFMYLYTLGYRPLIRLNHSFWKEEDDYGAAADNAIDLISRDRELDDDIKRRIREYFRDASQGGRYSSESEVYTGMMVWTVNGR